MCFSFSISLGTFAFSWLVSLYLLNKGLTTNQRHNVIFLMIFSSIQLVDAVLWYIGMKKNRVNYYVTSIFVPLILSMQIIYNLYFRNRYNNIILNVVVAFVVVSMFMKFNGYSVSLCEGRFSSPIWGGNEISYWQMVIFCVLIFYPDWNIILFSALILFPLIRIISKGGYGSLWCAIANIVAVKYLLTY
jgi:hypothetical protein